MEALISNPAADPHAYEPTAADARAVAEANLVISNGVGYDPWMDRLLADRQQSGGTINEAGTHRAGGSGFPAAE